MQFFIVEVNFGNHKVYEIWLKIQYFLVSQFNLKTLEVKLNYISLSQRVIEGEENRGVVQRGSERIEVDDWRGEEYP